MDTKEGDAQEKYHEISEKLEALQSEFSKFNAKDISNIDSEDADIFRKKILALESEADSYFKQFVYTRPRHTI